MESGLDDSLQLIVKNNSPGTLQAHLFDKAEMQEKVENIVPGSGINYLKMCTYSWEQKKAVLSCSQWPEFVFLLQAAYRVTNGK